MSDKFELFVREHRNALDAHEPSEAVWTKINSKMQPTHAIASKISWLKYFAYGASAVTVFVFLNLRGNTSDKKAATQKNIPAHSVALVAPTSNNMETIIDIPQTQTNVVAPSNVISPQASTTTTTSPAPFPLTFNPLSDHSADVAQQTDNSISQTTPFFASANKDGSKGKISINQSDTIFSGIKTLIISGSCVDVNVKGNSGDNVSVNARISIETKGAVRNKPDYEITYERKDSVLTVTVENMNKGNFVVVGCVNEQAVMNFDVPERTNLTVTNTSGNITASGLSGNVFDLQSNSGNINVDNINTNVKLHLTSGDLAATKIHGNVDAKTNSGNQTFDDVTGNMTVKSISGDLELSNVQGSLDVNTNSGNQRYNTIKGELKTGSISGDVDVLNMTGNSEINSNSGNIYLENYTGNPTMSSLSGDMNGKAVELIDSMQVKTNSGNVYMKLINQTDDLSFELESTSGNLYVNQVGAKMEDVNNHFALHKGKILIRGTTRSGDQTYK